MDSVDAFIANVAPPHRVNYDLLLQCYLAGMISEVQWVEHLKDEVFVRWLKKNYPQGL